MSDVRNVVVYDGGALWVGETDGRWIVFRRADVEPTEVANLTADEFLALSRDTPCALVPHARFDELLLPLATPRTCLNCNGSRDAKCEECNGSGDVERECDNCGETHDCTGSCEPCEGSGRVVCDCSAHLKVPHPLRVGNSLWDLRLICEVVGRLDACTDIEAGVRGDYLILRAGETYGLVMRFYGEPLVTYPELEITAHAG